MIEVNVHEAKTNLSRLLQRVVAGEEVVIARAGIPIARLVPINSPGGRRTLGEDEGLGWVAEDFDAPLPADLLEAFEGAAE